MSKYFTDEDGVLVRDAAIETGIGAQALNKRIDRGTLEYFLDSKGRRRIPFHVLDN